MCIRDSSILKGCQAKTNQPSELSDRLFERGEMAAHSSAANCRTKYFPATLVLWRPYFWVTPSMSP